MNKRPRISPHDARVRHQANKGVYALLRQSCALKLEGKSGVVFVFSPTRQNIHNFQETIVEPLSQLGLTPLSNDNHVVDFFVHITDPTGRVDTVKLKGVLVDEAKPEIAELLKDQRVFPHVGDLKPLSHEEANRALSEYFTQRAAAKHGKG